MTAQPLNNNSDMDTSDVDIDTNNRQFNNFRSTSIERDERRHNSEFISSHFFCAASRWVVAVDMEEEGGEVSL